MESKVKIKSLQGLRAIAFFGICTGHCQVSKLGAWGVSAFFVLSGFIMTYRHFDDESSAKLKTCIVLGLKRIGRLYPLHIIMMISAIYYIVGLIKGRVTFFEIFSNVMLIQSWIPIMGIYFSLNGVAWFLSTMLFLYIAFPFFKKKIKKIRNGFHGILIIISIYFVQLLVGYWISVISNNVNNQMPNFLHWATYICPLYRAGDFLIGCYTASIFIKMKVHPTVLTASFLELMTLFLIGISNYLYVKKIGIFNEEWFCNGLVYLPTSVMLVLFVAMSEGIISRILKTKAFVFLGDMSGW